MLAIKFHDDRYHDNLYYSKVGGIPQSELNCLEVELLGLLRYKLYVHPKLYAQYVEEVQKNVIESAPMETDCNVKHVDQDVSMENAKTLPSNAELSE